MANKFLMLMLLLGWGVSAQLIEVDVKTDSLASYIVSKDKEIKFLRGEVDELEAVLRYKDSLIDNDYKTINELLWYKKYYEHSHHILSAKLIARIEEMVTH